MEAIWPMAPALMRSMMAAMGGALRTWKPTSTLSLPSRATRRAISIAWRVWAMSTPMGFSQ